MNVTFHKTANHKHEIHINGFKAGLIQLLSHHPDHKVNDEQRMDWRVFFWGKYQQFQMDYRAVGIWPQTRGCNSDISLNQMKKDLEFLLQNNIDIVLPKKYFEDKGYVFAHFNDGDIYTIDTEYQDKWTEYFHIGGKHHLFASEEELTERVQKLFDYEKRNYDGKPHLLSENKILDIEYRMVNAMFDTSYYNSIKD